MPANPNHTPVVNFRLDPEMLALIDRVREHLDADGMAMGHPATRTDVLRRAVHVYAAGLLPPEKKSKKSAKLS